MSGCKIIPKSCKSLAYFNIRYIKSFGILMTEFYCYIICQNSYKMINYESLKEWWRIIFLLYFDLVVLYAERICNGMLFVVNMLYSKVNRSSLCIQWGNVPRNTLNLDFRNNFLNRLVWILGIGSRSTYQVLWNHPPNSKRDQVVQELWKS